MRESTSRRSQPPELCRIRTIESLSAVERQLECFRSVNAPSIIWSLTGKYGKVGFAGPEGNELFRHGIVAGRDFIGQA